MKNYKHKAFSIFEIVITIGIIGILAAVAAFTYPKYSGRSQITAANAALEAYVKAAQDFFTDNNYMPTGIGTSACIAPPSPCNIPISSYNATTNDILSNNGITLTPLTGLAAGTVGISLNATFSNKAVSALRQNQLILMLTVTNGIYTITCSAPNIPNDYLPSNCQQ